MPKSNLEHGHGDGKNCGDAEAGPEFTAGKQFRVILQANKIRIGFHHVRIGEAHANHGHEWVIREQCEHNQRGQQETQGQHQP